MRRKNLRKVVAGVMALTMVALAMGIFPAVNAENGNVISVSVVSAETDQAELDEFRDEIISDLELFAEGLGSSAEMAETVSDGIAAVEGAETFDELSEIWEGIKIRMSALL